VDQLALTRDVGRARDPLDRHFTTQPCADLLVRWLISEYCAGDGAAPMLVVEPSVGGGAFARAIRPYLADGGRILGYDIDPEAEGRADVDEWRCRSWLEAPDRELAGVDLVVGNPPFSGDVAIAHVARALGCGAQVVALVLPWAPLGGVAAWDELVDGEHRPVAAVPITPRPWPASVRETALYVWLPLEPTPRRTEVVRVGRWR
jgi:hypothetical protein